MIFLYSLLLMLLGGVKRIVQCRAASVAKAYSKLAEAVQKRLRESQIKPGNASKIDPCQSAKLQYELGLLVAKRDRVEAKHFVWQHRAEALARWVNTLSNWKGKKLPYTLGAIDLWLLLSAIDAIGFADFVSARVVFDYAVSLLTP